MYGYPSVTPMNKLREFFGVPIHTYTRAEAIEAGILVDATAQARKVGFRVSVAFTRAAWADCVEWTEADSKRQVHQDEGARLWDVLWMAFQAARRHTGKQAFVFKFYRVPRGGRGIRHRPTRLVCHIGPGDQGEPVVTIMMPGED